MSLNTLFSLLAFKRRPPVTPLKSIHTMQDAYEFIRKHFQTQARPAYQDGKGCVYLKRSTNETCAVGCMILAENYDEQLEGSSIYDGGVKEALSKSTSLDTSDMKLVEFLNAAQRTHDTTVGELKDSIPDLDAHAARFGLDVINT